MSIPGIGAIVAMTIINKIVDICRFPSRHRDVPTPLELGTNQKD